MRKSGHELFALREGIQAGHLQTINQAYKLGLLNDLMFDIVELFTFKTAGMLMRAATFNANFHQKDASGNTLLHALAKSEVHVLLTSSEQQVQLHRDYYLWAIQVLTDQGLSLQDKNTLGKTPLDICNKGFEEAVKLFETRQPYEDESLGLECSIL